MDTFSVTSYNRANYDNVVRLFCESNDLELSIDVHVVLFDALIINSKDTETKEESLKKELHKQFSIDILESPTASTLSSNCISEKPDYIMNCIVISSSANELFISNHGLLVQFKTKNQDTELPLLNADSFVICSIKIL